MLDGRWNQGTTVILKTPLKITKWKYQCGHVKALLRMPDEMFGLNRQSLSKNVNRIGQQIQQKYRKKIV